MHLRVLNNLGTPLEISECILIYCLLQKVDCETQLLWEDAAPTERLPKCNEFVKFLDTRCQKVENIELTNVELGILPQVVKPRKANIAALVAPTITDNQPNLTVNSEDWKIPAILRLAAPQFFITKKIDFLIGASLFFHLLCVGHINRFGWIVTGGGSNKA